MHYPVLFSLTDWEFWCMPLHCNIGFSSQCGSQSTWWAGEQTVIFSIHGLAVCRWGPSCFFPCHIAAAQDPIYCHNYVNMPWMTTSVSVPVVWRSEEGRVHSNSHFVKLCLSVPAWVSALKRTFWWVIIHFWGGTFLQLFWDFFFPITYRVDMLIMNSFCC